MALRFPDRARGGELLVGLGLAVLGLYTLAGTRAIPAASGYDQIGPRAFPTVIGAVLLLLGVLLAWRTLAGGWTGGADDAAHDNPDWPAFLLVSAGVLLHLAAIGWAGFILASTFLFLLVARGFGSRRPLRDLVAGALLSGAAYLLFTLGLDLSLPAGLLDFGI